MRIVRIAMAIGLAGLVLAGCSQPRPRPIAGCNYQMVRLSVGPGNWNGPDGQATRIDALFAATAADPVGQRLEMRLRERRALKAAALNGQPPADQFLVLSGGGQHGAFGAGFFYGLGSLPSYDIVTGVSTGSLQSSLLFLANQPVPEDRTDYSWVDGPLAGPPAPGRFTVLPHSSNIGDLVLAYSIDKEGNLMRVRAGGAAVGALLHGSSASFGPLRKRLRAIMTIGTLRAIGREWEEKKRQLFVGVSNLDDGEGYGIDMTELAARTLHAQSPAELDRIQGCYVDALLASSSVPPGVPPVTLQSANDSSSMYMDGGARFGVFLEPVLRALGKENPRGSRITLMVNTTLAAGTWSGTAQPVQRWTAPSAGLRAVDLLETQVYRFSVADVEKLGIASGWLRMAYLSDDNIPGGQPPQQHVFDGKTCAQWQEIDARAHPIQFYPHYMACTADYGRVRGAAQLWNHVMPNLPVD